MTVWNTIDGHPSIRLRTFGSLGIEDWSPDLLRQPKAFAVLVWLGVRGRDGYCRRDALAGAFWPDSTQDRARASLRNTLYVLRRHLPAGAIEAEGDETVRLCPNRVVIDAVALDEAVDDGRDEDVLELYRGPFLEAVHIPGAEGFSSWRDTQERRYQRLALAAALRLAERDGRDVADPRGDAWLERAVALAPLEDEPLRRLLTRFLARGDVAGAVTAYADHERRLATVDLAPAAATMALIDEEVRRAALSGREPPTHPDEIARPDDTRARGFGVSGSGPSMGMAPMRHAPRHRLLKVSATIAVVALAGTGVLRAVASQPEAIALEAESEEPTIDRMRAFVEAGDFVEAHRVALQLQSRLTGHEAFETLWDQATHEVDVSTEPGPARVAIRDYRGEGGWIELGTTPLESVRIPARYLRWQIETADGTVVERAGLDTSVGRHVRFVLPETATRPDMAYVSGDALNAGAPRAMPLDPYWLDRREVTNAEYSEFVVSSEYPNDARFRDRSGVPGPATWHSGTFAPARADFPVTGVSWNEADAYCRWVGKELPTLYHWLGAGGYHAHSDIIELSNFAGHGPAPAGASRAIGPYGHVDLAGNAREWVANATGGLRYIVGGAWDTPPYLYFAPDAADPLDRSSHNGFRCAVTDLPTRHASRLPVPRRREPLVLDTSPVTFLERTGHFDYDRLPLESEVDSVSEALPNWRREFVSFSGAYDAERLRATVFLPRHGSPPYPVVVYHPGAEANHLSDSRALHTTWFDFLSGAGYAVIHPVYAGTFERREAVTGPVGVRNQGIRRVLDVRRTLDYVEERPDLSAEGATYYGFSEGGVLAPIVAAIEPRIDAAIVLSGGLLPRRLDPVIDPGGYLAEAGVPLLMIGGELDFLFPLERSQRPYFEAWRAPDGAKRLILLPTGHSPRDLRPIANEVTRWLDARASLPPGRGEGRAGEKPH